jgi:hypothetical protein
MSRIYLRDGNRFVAMHERPYEAEELLQALIAEHPEVLAGDDDGRGRGGWALVKRETGVPDRPDGSGRWSLDHLFLDQAGVPTLVEVKRSSDTRTRREVVAQMLDYAANGTAHWNVESLRTWFEAEHVDPGGKLNEAFGVTDDDAYWETVKTNLAAERVRLVFVADEIPPELRSIIEFLNRQMTETEVLAIEVKQYVDAEGQRQTIVPRLLGQTEAAKATKSAGRRPTRAWNEQSLLAEIARLHGAAAAETASAVLSWAKGREDVRIDYGQGASQGSAQVRFQQDGMLLLTAFSAWTYGRIAIPFDLMESGSQAPFAESRDARDELRRRINDAVPAANIPSEDVRRNPSFDLTALTGEQARQGFFAAMEWAFDQAVRAQGISDHLDRA